MRIRQRGFFACESPPPQRASQDRPDSLLTIADRFPQNVRVISGYFGHKIQWCSLMAAASVITLPVLALALCVQRYIVRGLVSGAVTG
jgi:ABC-type glycerol-3-phosphate transport system permease component